MGQSSSRPSDRRRSRDSSLSGSVLNEHDSGDGYVVLSVECPQFVPKTQVNTYGMDKLSNEPEAECAGEGPQLAPNVLLNSHGETVEVLDRQWSKGLPVWSKRVPVLNGHLPGKEQLIHAINCLSNPCEIEDDSPEEVEAECAKLTKSQLSNVPVVCSTAHLLAPFMEMDTNLCILVKAHSKEESSVQLKLIRIPRQLTQAFMRLHSPNPTAYSNVLSNSVFFLHCIRRDVQQLSQIQIFSTKSRLHMLLESRENSPLYNDKLHVFSSGSLAISRVTQEFSYYGFPSEEENAFVFVTAFAPGVDYLETFTAKEEESVLASEQINFAVIPLVKLAMNSPPLHATLCCFNVDVLTSIYNKEHRQQIALAKEQGQRWVVLDPSKIEIGTARSLGTWMECPPQSDCADCSLEPGCNESTSDEVPIPLLGFYHSKPPLSSRSPDEQGAVQLNADDMLSGHSPGQPKHTPVQSSKEATNVEEESDMCDQQSVSRPCGGKDSRPFMPEGCNSPIVHNDILNDCCMGIKDVQSVPSVKDRDGDLKHFKAESVNKHSLSDFYAINAMELCERVSGVEVLRKNKAILKLKKSNVALKRRVQAAVQQCQRVKQANWCLTEELEEVRGELEYCLTDREEYMQESHILKLENARLAGNLVDYEALRNKWEAAQLQLFQAKAEKDHYRERSLELKTKLLFETEARIAAEKERQMMLKDYEALQRAYEELKVKESSRLEEQVFKVDDYQTRLSMLQSEVVSLKDEHDVVKIHRDKFGSNLRQFASEHESLQEQFMSFSKELFGGVQMKMVQSIKEYERLETAQDTVAEHIKAATVKTKSAENELHKMERETERYRRQLTDFPCSFGGDLLHHVIPTTAARWREFAMYLGIDMCTIRAVEAKDSAAEDCCRDILLHWKEGAGKSPKTWATILEAMRLCGLTKGANEMEKNLCFE